MANYEMTVRLNKKQMPDLKEKFSKMAIEEAGPDIVEAIRNIILYRKMNPGQGKDWPTFIVANAGLFSAAIIENIKKKYINFGKGTGTGVRLDSTPTGVELVITAELSEDGAKEVATLNPEAIMKMVTGLDPATASSIFRKAADKAGYN